MSMKKPGAAGTAKKSAARAAPRKAAARSSTAGHIMEAPKGPRTVSHRRIQEAVEKVFRERNPAHA